MPIKVILHVANEDPIIAEIDEMPSRDDTLLVARNPTRRDGKELHYLMAEVMTVIWPMHRINFVEILPTEEEEAIIGFVRE
jgi:hypothetical protein